MRGPGVLVRDSGRFAPGPDAQINRNHPLSRGLVAIGCGLTWWGLPGSLTMPGYTRAPEPSPSGIGFAPAIFGNNGGYRVATQMTLPNSLTLAATIKLSGANPTNGYAISWNGYADNGVSIGNGTGDGPGPNIKVFEGGVAHNDTAVNISNGRWTTIATSRTTGNGVATMYVDGVLVDTGTANFNTPSNSMIVIGTQVAGGRAFFGAIGTWAAWSRILTPSEHNRFHMDPFQMLDGS